ncbi:cyclin-dependent kinase 2-associated protein 2-like [Bacillus rossius redtenbacheri]|uniref:cyclin-dependent kinase 2-associated protein 2-like n=1 Tax=Bacillus rossius redtenbacheri TaxID=93214 RepID=UPI002FDEBD78
MKNRGAMDEDLSGLDSPMLASPAELPATAGVFPGTVRLPQHSPGVPGGAGGLPAPPGQSKYAQLLAVIEEMGKDIRPTYAGSKSSAERLKRCIVHARILVRECLVETERSARQ